MNLDSCSETYFERIDMLGNRYWPLILALEKKMNYNNVFISHLTVGDFNKIPLSDGQAHPQGNTEEFLASIAILFCVFDLELTQFTNLLSEYSEYFCYMLNNIDPHILEPNCFEEDATSFLSSPLSSSSCSSPPEHYSTRCGRRTTIKTSYEDIGDDDEMVKKCRHARNSNRKRENLPKPATNILRTWLFNHVDHPYPTEEEKQTLIGKTGLSLSQISNWFINARRRILQPMLEAVRLQERKSL